jgi:hypothetical protein
MLLCDIIATFLGYFRGTTLGFLPNPIRTTFVANRTSDTPPTLWFKNNRRLDFDCPKDYDGNRFLR